MKLFVEYPSGKKFVVNGKPIRMELSGTQVLVIDEGVGKRAIILDPRAIVKNAAGKVVLQLSRKEVREALNIWRWRIKYNTELDRYQWTDPVNQPDANGVLGLVYLNRNKSIEFMELWQVGLERAAQSAGIGLQQIVAQVRAECREQGFLEEDDENP